MNVSSDFDSFPNRIPSKIAGFELIQVLSRRLESQSPCWTHLARSGARTPIVLKSIQETEASLLHRRLDREVEIYRLGLEGIPEYQFHGQADGFKYLAIEFMEDASDLQRLVETAGALSVSKTLIVAQQIAKTFARLHSRGWLHHDLKPGNLLCDTSNELSLIDFGLTATVEESRDPPNAISGTPTFLAPEAIECRPKGFTSDIYSFGCTLYFLLCGKPAITGNNALEICWRQIHAEPEEFPKDLAVPSKLKTLIYSCMEKDANNRPGSFDEILSVLGSI